MTDNTPAPEKMPEEKYPLQIVTINKKTRCVYVNNFRLVGSKPYVSEGGDSKHFEFTYADLCRAFPDLIIRPKKQRKK